MASFETAVRALIMMKEDGVIADYAVAGGMAQAFWAPIDESLFDDLMHRFSLEL